MLAIAGAGEEGVAATDDMRCSTEGSAGVVLRDLRKDMRPGASGVIPWAMVVVVARGRNPNCLTGRGVYLPSGRGSLEFGATASKSVADRRGSRGGGGRWWWCSSWCESELLSFPFSALCA